MVNPSDRRKNHGHWPVWRTGAAQGCPVTVTGFTTPGKTSMRRFAIRGSFP